jgi:uncharacterized protein (TIGR02996 family)
MKQPTPVTTKHRIMKLTQQQRYVQTIIANVDDDAPRLVYADWLEEHGDADRAEFIRAQCELAQPPARGTRTRRRQLDRRVKVLWQQHGADWEKQPGGGNAHLKWWERGFCAHHYAKTFAAMQAELPRRLTEAPIQHIRIGSTQRTDLGPLVVWPLLARLRSLDLFAASAYGKERTILFGDPDVKVLVSCPYLTRLEGLKLHQHNIGAEGLRVLTHAATLPALCDLEMYGNRWSDEAIKVVCESPLAPRLRKLHAGGGSVADFLTPTATAHLATTAALANLRVLNLDNTRIGDFGAHHLALAPHFAGLTELWLHECELRDEGVKAIANSRHLANLEVLDLTSNWSVGHRGAVALIKSPYLKRIRYLDLWRCEGIVGKDEQLLRKRFRSRVNFERSY